MMPSTKTNITTFQSYIDDLNSSTGCCRSASLLIPTCKDTNGILRQLRVYEWLCESVLVRPWRNMNVSSVDAPSAANDPWYYQCLPNEDELQYLQRKYAMASLSTSSNTSLQKDIVQYHTEAKSLLVPLKDDATAFILRVLFDDEATNNYSDGDKQKENAISNWFSTNRIMIVHNCDGNQIVSLCKEVDSFPKPSPVCTNDNQFTFIDLFAGIGGFRIALEALGGICVGSCEIDQYARDTYRRNFLEKKGRDEFYVNDITRLDIPSDTAVDVLCGGFPCQSFSTMASFPSNNTNQTEASIDSEDTTSNRRQGGLDTPRKGKLFFHLLRILRKSRPKLFIFENVKGLMKLDNGKQFQTILRLLEESGYRVLHVLVDSAWCLPQRRERVYFIGIRFDLLDGERSESIVSSSQLKRELRNKYQIYGNDIPDTQDKYDRVLAPQPNLNQQHSLPPSNLGDILENHESVLANQSHCFLTKSQWQKVQSQGYSQVHLDGSGQLLTEEDACAQTLVSSYRSSYLMHSQFIVPSGTSYLIEQREQLLSEACRKKGVTEQSDTAAGAEEANTTASNDQTLPRFFTPRECCRLQGFPEDFVLPFTVSDNKDRNFISQFYRQIGNAVSPPCVATVAEHLVSIFLVPNNKDRHSSVVFDLILQASPDKQKVLAAINRKQHTYI